MLTLAVIFFVILLIAGFIGYSGVAGAAAVLGKVLFFLFLVLFLGSVILGLTVFS